MQGLCGRKHNEMNTSRRNLRKTWTLLVTGWPMRLKLNPDKTDLYHLVAGLSSKRVHRSIEVGDATVNASTDVKYLGAHLDQTLDFKKQVMMKTWTARFNLSKIRNIRKFLTKEAAETVMLGLVMSHLDYSNRLMQWTASHNHRQAPDYPKPSSQSHTKPTKICQCNSCNVQATLAPNQTED